MSEQESKAVTDAKKSLGGAMEDIEKRQYLNALYHLAEATRSLLTAFSAVLKEPHG